MYALTKMRATSMQSGGSIEFNEQQKQLLHTTTKYVTLLSLAMLSSWMAILIGVILTASLGFSDEIFRTIIILENMDCKINILCLYLQYPFNREYYDKYCVCFVKSLKLLCYKSMDCNH